MNNVFIGRAAIQATYFELYRQDKISESELLFLTATLWGDYAAQGLLGRAMITPAGMSIWVPVVVGYGVSYAIAGEEGVDDYVEFLIEPKKMPGRTWESMKEIIPYVYEKYHLYFSILCLDIF